MIVINAVARAHRGLAVLARVPRKRKVGRQIVAVAVKDAVAPGQIKLETRHAAGAGQRLFSRDQPLHFRGAESVFDAPVLFVRHGVEFVAQAQREFEMRANRQLFGDEKVFLPAFVLPYLIARTAEVEKALCLRQWGVPFDALAYAFGHAALFWYRAWLACGRPPLVGTTVKDADRMPAHLVAHEKITWLDKAAVCVPTPGGGGCVLGSSVAATADSAALQQADGEFAAEAAPVWPDYQPASVIKRRTNAVSRNAPAGCANGRKSI